ncbi:MAG: 50S ribosomal protein L30e, partial [Thermoprotei archaeon]
MSGLDVVREIQTALRTGKVVLGSKQTLKMVVTGRAKLVII